MLFSSKNTLAHIKNKAPKFSPNQVSHHSKYRQLFRYIFNDTGILSLLSTLGFNLKIWTKSAKTPVFSRLLTFCPYYNSIVYTTNNSSGFHTILLIFNIIHTRCFSMLIQWFIELFSIYCVVWVVCENCEKLYILKRLVI